MCNVCPATIRTFLYVLYSKLCMYTVGRLPTKELSKPRFWSIAVVLRSRHYIRIPVYNTSEPRNIAVTCYQSMMRWLIPWCTWYGPICSHSRTLLGAGQIDNRFPCLVPVGLILHSSKVLGTGQNDTPFPCSTWYGLD